MSKDLAFEEMEMQNEMLTAFHEGHLSFPHDFSKKKAKQQGVEAAKALVDAGEVDVIDALSNFTRLEELVRAFVSELRRSVELPEKEYVKNGVKFTMRSTGDRYDYAQDDVYATLQKKLKDREELLKLALKSDQTIYDSDGVEVPRVGVKTYGKETLVITY